MSGRDYEIVEGSFILTYRSNCAVVRPEMENKKKIIIKNKEVYKNFLKEICISGD